MSLFSHASDLKTKEDLWQELPLHPKNATEEDLPFALVFDDECWAFGDDINGVTKDEYNDYYGIAESLSSLHWAKHNTSLSENLASSQFPAPLMNSVSDASHQVQFMKGILRMLANRDKEGEDIEPARQTPPQPLEGYVDIERWANEYLRARFALEHTGTGVPKLLTLITNNFYQTHLRLMDNIVKKAISKMKSRRGDRLETKDFALRFDLIMSQDLPFRFQSCDQIHEIQNQASGKVTRLSGLPELTQRWKPSQPTPGSPREKTTRLGSTNKSSLRTRINHVPGSKKQKGKQRAMNQEISRKQKIPEQEEEQELEIDSNSPSSEIIANGELSGSLLENSGQPKIPFKEPRLILELQTPSLFETISGNDNDPIKPLHETFVNINDSSMVSGEGALTACIDTAKRSPDLIYEPSVSKPPQQLRTADPTIAVEPLINLKASTIRKSSRIASRNSTHARGRASGATSTPNFHTAEDDPDSSLPLGSEGYSIPTQDSIVVKNILPLPSFSTTYQSQIASKSRKRKRS